MLNAVKMGQNFVGQLDVPQRPSMPEEYRESRKGEGGETDTLSTN